VPWQRWHPQLQEIDDVIRVGLPGYRSVVADDGGTDDCAPAGLIALDATPPTERDSPKLALPPDFAARRLGLECRKRSNFGRRCGPAQWPKRADSGHRVEAWPRKTPPGAYISASMSAFASFRSAVSKPSVNLPYIGASNSSACVRRPSSPHNRARLVQATSSAEYSRSGGTRSTGQIDSEPRPWVELGTMPR
jgi:hypothetical protein